jgi:hypothetical protein
MNWQSAPWRLLSPRFVFFSLSVVVLLAFSLSPTTRKRIGIFDGGQLFLDSYAVLASSDANVAGIDPDAPNPYDVLERSHKYSDWWFGLSKLGLTREDNLWVGGLWVFAFLATVFLTIKPTGYLAAIWLAVLLSSPSVLLGINRANNDLVVFALLGMALIALRSDSTPRCALAVALVALATGLKFYPVVAAGAFILVRSKQQILRAGGLALGIAGLALASVGSQVSRGSFAVGPKPHRMGGRMIFLDLGLSESAAALATLLCFVAAVGIVVWFGWGIKREADRDLSDNRRMMTMGSIVLVTCFLLGINISYRWIFALWTAPWLWSNRRTNPAAKLGVWLLPFSLWHDGILCFAINRWLWNRPLELYDRIEVLWRAVTEPLVWALMVLLGAWLFNVLRGAVREIQTSNSFRAVSDLNGRA